MSILRREHILYIIRTRALALLALLALVGCTSDDATLSEPIPEPTPADGKVAVELALCVSPSQLATTRQPAHENPSSDAFDVTQLSGKYRGIQDLTLIPLSSEGAVLEGSFPGLSRQGETYHYFTDQLTELYIGTSRFLCYAKATPLTATEESDDVKRKFKNGSINATFGDKAPSNIKFDLEPTCTEDYSVATNLAEYLTSIATHTSWPTLTVRTDFLGLYSSFINESGKIAGSSANIKALVNEFYHKVREVAVAGSETAVEEARTAILTAITTDVTYSGSGADLTITNLDGTTTSKKREGYPGDIGLPDGAAAMKWDGTKFVNITEGITGTPLSDHKRFVYPAELYYYSSSNIKTSTSSKASAYTYTQWYDKTGTSGVLNQYDEDDAVVASTTRSVAIKDPLNYGVSCLILTMKADAEYNETTGKWYLQDNNETPVSVNLINNDGNKSFPLTGVLIGGQYQQLYNFKPVSDPAKGSTTPKPTEYIIYDREVSSGIYLNTATTDEEVAALIPNYTLVFQSRDERPVDIVLEFENNSDVDFMGLGGIVYRGTKFYLVGQAWPQPTRTEDEWHRVFTQDHKTTLLLSIQSLKNAYNVIPDLKTAQYAVKVANVAIRSWVDAGIKSSDLYNW